MKKAKEIIDEIKEELESGNDVDISEYDYLAEESLYEITQYDRNVGNNNY